MDMASLFDLRGRTALVTGGNSGVGEAMATALGLAGARLVLIARREQALAQAVRRLEQAGVEAFALRCDLADVAALREMATEAGRR